MSSDVRNPHAALLAEAWSLLGAGRDRDAADLFGRLLLHDPFSPEARHGLAQARAAAAERVRRLDVGLSDARAAAEAGNTDLARVLLERIVEEGGDRDRALAALDRLDGRGGRVEPDLTAGAASVAGVPARPAGRASGWARRALAAACAACFAVLAVGVDAQWDGLIRVLERAPRPHSAATPASSAMAPLSAGEQALADARRMLEQGDTAGALRALEAVRPEEPAYPFARQLRTQTQSTLRAGGSD